MATLESTFDDLDGLLDLKSVISEIEDAFMCLQIETEEAD